MADGVEAAILSVAIGEDCVLCAVSFTIDGVLPSFGFWRIDVLLYPFRLCNGNVGV